MFEAVQTGLSVVSQGARVVDLLTKVWSAVRHGRTRIAVFGIGGSGKTTLGRLLAGERPWEELASYAPSLIQEKYRREDDFFCRVVVPPGQQLGGAQGASAHELTDIPLGWRDVLREVERGGHWAIVHVVSDGHAALQAGVKLERESPQGPVAAPVDAVLEAARAQELEAMRQLRERVDLPKGAPRLRMLTLVAKQDLWWPARARVEAHYAAPSGAYASHVAGLRQRLGSGHFEHRYEAASLARVNLREVEADGTGGRTLVETAAGYDGAIEQTYRKRMLAAVEWLVEKP